MKLTLSPKNRQQLLECQKALTAGLAKVTAHQAALAKMQEEADALPDLIARRERKVDPMNDAAVLSLAKDETKLRLLNSRIEQGEARGKTLEAELRAQTAAAAAFVPALIQSPLRQLEREISHALAPYFGADRIPALVRESASLQTLVNFANGNCTGYADAALGAQEALRLVTMLLEGQLPRVHLS